MHLGCTHRELLQRVDSYELEEWKAFSILEPFGREADDVGCGIVAAQIINVNKKKGAKPAQAKDFTPDYGQRYRNLIKAENPQSTEQIKTIMMQLVNETKK